MGRSLMLFAPDEWHRLAAIFRKTRRMELDDQLLEAFIFGGSANLPIDRRWRVRIPSRLLKFAHGLSPNAALPAGEPRTVLLCRPNAIPSQKG